MYIELIRRSYDMKCPVCGAAELIHDTRDETYTYKGESTIIPAVKGDFCPACDESLLDAAETERVMREMRVDILSGLNPGDSYC
jgi:YgiT-type zinc finger domain-containing protein